VRRAGERVRVAVQLVNAADGYQLWNERYDRELEDIFAIQEEIAHNIVRALEVTLSPRERRAMQFTGVSDVRAYEYYLRGRTYFHRFDGRNLEFASQTFQHALDIDPEFARAWAGLADCEAFAYMYYESSKARRERALDASRRAVELAPDLAEAHASRGLAHMLNADYDEAETEFERAEELDPRLFEAWYFHGRACFQRGEIERAAKLFEQAAAVRPEDYQALLLASSIYTGLDLHEKAADTARRGIEAAERQLELNPEDVRALYLSAGARLELGDRDAAIDCAERARALDPDDSVVLHNVACLYARAGDPDKALDCLERGVSRVGGLAAGGAAWYRQDPDLKSLHGHPRFEALLDRATSSETPR
jgi:tetratricopeptide (TPR) repeat protein